MASEPSQLTMGLGLKPEHFQEAISSQQSGLWFEVHTENYFISGGPRLQSLGKIRQHHEISLHGVGASLGGPALPDIKHLQQVKSLVTQFEPVLISEHAVWSQLGGTYFADLLPLPRTNEALERLADGVDAYQNGIGRRILVENPTNYLPFLSEMDESEFLVEVARRTGCGLLIDVNNLYLSARNCAMDPISYLEAIPADLVGEIHVAGYDEDPHYGEQLLIDSHGSPVSDDVWGLLKVALELFGAKPVLLERDANVPQYSELMHERRIGERVFNEIFRKRTNELA